MFKKKCVKKKKTHISVEHCNTPVGRVYPLVDGFSIGVNEKLRNPLSVNQILKKLCAEKIDSFLPNSIVPTLRTRKKKKCKKKKKKIKKKKI